MMKVSVFTPTKGRPEALSLCRKFVERQEFPIHEHIIEEGGTLAANLKTGLLKVTGDIVVVFEDDDHYKPGYIKWCAEELEQRDIIGEATSRYYHLPSGCYAEHQTGPQRASLCNTAFRKELIPHLTDCAVENLVGIDSRFWTKVCRIGVRFWTRGGSHFVTGMKGLPGTKGMGIGHRPETYRTKSQPDVDRTILREWVGDEDTEMYLSLLKEWDLAHV